MDISVVARKPDLYHSLFYCCCGLRDLDLGRALAFMSSKALGPSFGHIHSDWTTFADIFLSIL